MIDTLDFLIQLTKHPELKDNILAYVFAANPDINLSSREKFYDNVVHYYDSYVKLKPVLAEKTTEQNISIDWRNKDLRIKKIELSSVRGYPKSNKPFTVDFTHNDKPTSMIILGGNATGKSSIYDPLEFCYCGSIGAVELRKYKTELSESDRCKDYLSHYDNGFINSICNVHTVDSILQLQKDNIPDSLKQLINPKQHFISDADTYNNGQLDYQNGHDKSFHNLIAESLGLKKLLDFEKQLKSFVNYRRQTESRRIAALKRENDANTELINRTDESINIAKAELSNTSTNKVNTNAELYQQLSAILTKVKRVNTTLGFDLSVVENHINEFIDLYRKYTAISVDVLSVKKINFLKSGLEILPEHTDCPFCDNSKYGTEEIRSSVEKRLEEYNEANSLNTQLSNKQKETEDLLFAVINQIDYLLSTLDQEIADVREYTEYNDLSILDNNIRTKLLTYTGNDFYNDTLKLESNPNYLKDKNQYTFTRFEKNFEHIKTDLNNLCRDILEYFTQRTLVIQSIESSIVSNQQVSTVDEKIIRLKKTIEDYELQIASTLKKIEDNDDELTRLQETLQSFNNIKDKTSEYVRVYSNELANVVDSKFKPIKGVLEEVLETYFNTDKRKVKLEIRKVPLEYDEETGEVISEVITANIIDTSSGHPPMLVSKYLNTFHYRLFCTMVSVSMALVSRMNTGVNMPLVLDDIFYASDYENRVTIESFLEKIFEIFSKYTSDLPLQLILFTHDQLVFESASKLASKIKEQNIRSAKLNSLHYLGDNNKDLLYVFPINISQIVNSLSVIYEENVHEL